MSNFTIPVVGTITSYFGDREQPTSGASTDHKGIDISAPVGSSVVSALTGVIRKVGYSSVRGNYITVDHGNGLTSTYGHLKSSVVSEGMRVTEGQQIGLSGNTGVTTGPHLHFEMAKNGVKFAPLSYSGSGGDILAINGNVLEVIKKNWILIAAGLLVLMVLK